MKHQRKTVDAVAQAGRLRPVVEDVAEMAAAAAAMNFGAQHAEGAVLGLADGVFERLVEARPAGAALEFGLGGEQRQVAAGAGEDALAVLLQQRARARALGALLAQDFILLRRQLRAPFGVGLFDLEFLGGLRRAWRAASGRRQGQTGWRRRRAGYGGRSSMVSVRSEVVRSQIRRARRGSYTDPSRIFSLSCEARPHRVRFARRFSRRRPAAGGSAAAAAPGGRRRRRRPGSGLAVGLGQPRLADALPGPRPLPVAGQRAGGGGTSPSPHADQHGRRPGRSRRPPRPVRTARTAASARRPTGCCARSTAPPSPRCSGPGGRSRSRPTGLCATGRSAACRARSVRPRRRRRPRSRPCRAAERSCGCGAAMAAAKRCGRAAQVVSGLAHIRRSPSTIRK